ncbi:hypothetical protein [Bradyrhizobium sp. sBnM-33]|uniref:hypothetical protein n=1 Tax=Bradyrhizobium sp. sBnM-33 TaxID=2831780 RepID=UPI0020C11E33|nr:hypothetical protein [Bradyrhizobium sp. sBnM-33]
MKRIAIILSALLGSYAFALAQGSPSGRGSTTGDPAASSANPPRCAKRNHRLEYIQSRR